MITGSMRSTPIAGMEVLLGLTPIDIFVKETAVATSTRLARTGHWRESVRRPLCAHTTITNDIRDSIPEINFPQDKSWFKVKIDNKFKLVIADRETFLTNKIRPMPWDPGIANVFTDGSKSDFGTGVAYIIYSHIHRSQDYIHLGEHATVFQAEVAAISMAAIDLLDADIQDHDIQFHIDSQGAIKALSKLFTNHRCIVECKRLLNKLTENNNQVQLNWIPGHSGQLGNGVADGLAKLGAEYADEGLEPRLPASDSTIKGFIKEWTNKEHERQWNEATEYRQTKLVLPDVKHRWKKYVCSYNRNELRILTQIVTGHASLKRHLFLMGYVDSPNCEKCGEEQTSIHVMTTCPGLAGLRTAVLGKPILEPRDIRKVDR